MVDRKYTDEFPFFYQSLNNTTNPGWNDVADTYPAIVGSPDADQCEVRINADALSGIYQMGVSGTYHISSTNNSIQARFSLNGGAFWENFSRESKDTTDRYSFVYLFPLPHSGGAFDFVMQIKKENLQQVLEVFFANIWFDRKS